MSDNVNFESKINSKPDVNFEPKNSSSLDETSFSLDNITLKLDMRMNLKLESWVKNKKDYSSDQNEWRENIKYYEKFQF